MAKGISRKAYNAGIAAATKKANQLASRRATAAAAKAQASQRTAVRSATTATRARTLQGVEKNMGGVQRAGRAIDRGVGKVKAGFEAGRDKLNAKVDKAMSVEKKAMKAVGGFMAGTDLGRGGKSPLFGKVSNKTLTKVGRGTVYGTAAAAGGAYAVGRASGSTGSSWSEKKKEGGSSGWQRPTPYGF